MEKFLTSKVRAVLIILSAMIVLLVVFGLGIDVGYDRASFGSHFAENYSHNFNTNVMPVPGELSRGSLPGPMGEHGIVGSVIDITTSTISVQDPTNNEHSIVVSSGTLIREGNNNIFITDIALGNKIAVIGEPTAQGQIDARFIRVFTN